MNLYEIRTITNTETGESELLGYSDEKGKSIPIKDVYEYILDNEGEPLLDDNGDLQTRVKKEYTIIPMSDDEIESQRVKMVEFNTQRDAVKYKELRAKEYPKIEDQLDYIYHNGIDAWKTDMIDPVKVKYPKP